MAHEIEFRNGKAAMAYSGSTPWHNLGTKVEESDLYSWPSFCRKAHLDWAVELVELQTADDQQTVTHRAVRRTDDRQILGVVGPDYHPLQNQDAFAWFEPFLASKEAQLHTAGSLRHGTRVWVQALLNRGPMEIAPNDLVQKKILLSHSHDGSLAIRCGFTPERVVCANTLAMAHSSTASQLVRFKHTKGAKVNLDNLRDVMNLANADFEATAEQYRLLAKRDINQADLAKYVRRILKVEEEGEISTRMSNIIKEITRLFEEGKGNNLPGVRGTYWAAYNGATEYLAYERGAKAEGRLDSLWFGSSAQTNRLALETALEMAG